MKKQLRYFLTLLLVMVASVGWANETTVTYKFVSKSWGAVLAGTQTEANWTSGKDGAGYNNEGVQVTTNASGANAASPDEFSNVSKIVVTYNTNKSRGEGTIKIQIGENEEKSQSAAYSGSGDGTTANYTVTFDNIENESGFVKITAECTNNSLYIKSIAITYSSENVATPTFTPVAGTYNDAQNVTIATTTEGATIYYTTDGADPTTASSVYIAAIPVDENTTIKAYAVKDGMTDSEIATAEYVINYVVENPVFSPEAGSYTEAQNVTITCATDGATIYYTTDGSDPDDSSNEYSAAIPVTANTTIKAIAMKDGYTASEIITATYEIVDWVYDELTYDLIGVEGTGYSPWTGKSTGTSDAVYAGNSAGGNTSIQMRSTNNSGIVTTTSGGKARQVVVVWNSSTADARVLDVYGKNTPYESAADLYGDDKGTKLGSIAKANGTTLNIEGDYEYIGIRSNSGAMWLNMVKIAWEAAEGVTVTIGETEYATLYYGNVGLIVPEGVTANAYSVSGTTLNVVQTYNAGDVIPAATGVVLNGAEGNYTFNITEENGTAAEGNMLRGSDVDETTTGGAKYYMLSLNEASEAGSVGFYYGAADGAAFTNKAHRAYLAVPEGTEAKATGYPFNDDVTGINHIESELTNGQDAWYTIDGKRLNGVPTVKGIYVVNGKKVVIK